jgi:hypothetical protein
VIRFSHLPGFGIEAEGIDLGALTDDGFAQLQHAFYKHHVLAATVLTGRFGSLRGSERFSGADRLRGTRERRFDRRASGSALTHPLIRF